MSVPPRLSRDQTRTAELASLMRSLPQGVLFESLDRRVVYANQRWCDLFSIAEPALIEGTLCAEGLQAAKGLFLDPEAFVTRVEMLVELRTPIFDERLHRNDGLIYERTYCPVFDAEDTACGHLWLYTDVTDKVQLEAQLQQTRQMESLTRLAGEVAHDLNNTLQGIRACAELLEITGDDRTRRQTYVTQLNHAVSRAADTVAQLMALGRRGLPNTDVCTCLLEEGQRLGLEMVPHLSASTALTIHVANAPMRVALSRDVLHDILLALVRNAAEAISDEGGSVHIAFDRCWHPEGIEYFGLTAAPGEYVRVRVKDTGHGMSDTVLERVVEPFFSTRTEQHGRGMGLALVYGFLEQVGGTLNIQSQVDHGTTVDLWIPHCPSSRTTHMAIQHPLTILYAEDDDLIRDATCTLLEQASWRIITACDGHEALERFKQHADTIDVLLLDLRMPRLDGLEVWRRCTAMKPGLPVLFVSGYTDWGSTRGLLRKLGLSCLRKPFSRRDLLRTIQGLVQSRAAGNHAQHRLP